MKTLFAKVAWLFNGSVSRRLSLVMSVLVALTVVTGLASLSGLRDLNVRLETSIEQQAGATDLVNQMLEQARRLSESTRAAAAAPTPEERQRALAELDAAKRALGELVDRISTQLQDQPELRSAIEQGFSSFVISAVKASRLLASGRDEEARNVMLTQLEPKLLEFVLTTISAISNDTDRSTRAVADAGHAGYERSRALLVPMIGLALFALLAGHVLVNRTVVRPVRRMVRAAETLAEGTFDVDLQSQARDECGEMLRAMAKLGGRLHTVARVQGTLLAAQRVGTVAVQDGDLALPGVYGDLVRGVKDAVVHAHAAQQEVQKEMLEVTAAIARGDFSRRLSLNGKEGIWLELTRVLNEVTNGLDASFRSLSVHLKHVAGGDLSQRFASGQEGMFADLGRDLNQTVHNLGDMVNVIRRSSEIVTRAAEDFASGNSDLLKRSESQAHELKQASGALNSISSSAQQGAQRAHDVNALMQAATGAAARGSGVVTEVVSTMQQIASASARIEETVGLIREIAFKTNILSLNAAVEAARAGDHGRGFAVVAGEVRALAFKSASAAKEIEALIRDSVEKVEKGKRLAGEAGAAMSGILGQVQGAAQYMDEISTGSRHQSERMRMIADAIGQVDEVTRRNAAMVQDAAAAAETLRAEARTLIGSVAAFRVQAATAQGPNIERPAVAQAVGASERLLRSGT